jgi:predicted nucleotidyltransferase
MPEIPNGSKIDSIKKALIRFLQNQTEICFAVLYGSAADSQVFRDVDIGLFVNREAVLPTSDLDYAFTLADQIQDQIKFPVDVRVINDAPLPFRYNVSHGIPLIVNDKEVYARFLERTWDEYLDFQPVALQYLKEQQ